MAKLQIEQALRFGWEATRKNFWFFFGVSMLSFFIGKMVPQVLGKMLNMSGATGGWALGFAFVVVTLLLSSFVRLGVIKISLQAVDQKPLVFRDFFDIQGIFLPFLLATIIVNVVSAIGYILLIVPGIIISLTLMFYSFLIVDQKMAFMDSLRGSYAITKGFRPQLLGFVVIAFLVNVLGALLLFIGLLWTIPMTLIATAHIYRQLSPAK